MVRKSSDNNKPEVKQCRCGMVYDLKLSRIRMSHQTVLRRITWERFAGRITPNDHQTQ